MGQFEAIQKAMTKERNFLQNSKMNSDIQLKKNP